MSSVRGPCPVTTIRSRYEGSPHASDGTDGGAEQQRARLDTRAAITRRGPRRGFVRRAAHSLRQRRGPADGNLTSIEQQPLDADGGVLGELGLP